jgi:hypothetical protein
VLSEVARVRGLSGALFCRRESGCAGAKRPRTRGDRDRNVYEQVDETILTESTFSFGASIAEAELVPDVVVPEAVVPEVVVPEVVVPLRELPEPDCSSTVPVISTL